MLHRFITDDHAERLLAGHAGAGDDDELADMANLFAALRAPSQASELAGTDDLVALIATAVRNGGIEAAQPPRRKPVLARIITAKVAAVSAVVLFSAGAAAAATGHLPDPLQRTVSNTFSHVGLELPSPADEPATNSTDPASTSTSTMTSDESDTTTTPTTGANAAAVGPDANGPAKHGLCNAFLNDNGHDKNPDAVAFRNLTAAATAAGQTVAEFCAPTSDTTTTVVTADDDSGRPADRGNSGSTPAATAPGQTGDRGNSGSTPAATAPGQADKGNSDTTAPGQPENKGKRDSTPSATAPGRTASSTTTAAKP
jgi:hypothetical protein